MTRAGRIRLVVYMVPVALLLAWGAYRWIEGPRGTVDHGTGHANPEAYRACATAAEAAFGGEWSADPADSASVATGRTLQGPVAAAVLLPVRNQATGAIRSVECRLEPSAGDWQVRSMDVEAL